MTFPFFSRRQSLTEANEKERRETVERLFALSTHDYGYYLFLTLSILISTAGILLKSPPVVIGGMIIAPILLPLLACGLAMLLLEWKGFVHSLTIILISVLTALVLSSAMTILTMLVEPEAAVLSYDRALIPPGLYLVIAFSSGVAGAFAFVKEHLSASFSGVAVSASLVPPLCSVGIAIAQRNDALMKDSLSIFLLNVAGIVLAAALVFWILGFWDVRHLEEQAAEQAAKKDS